MSTVKPGTASGGFDTALIEPTPGAFKMVTKRDYLALPLSDRIRYVLERKVKFHRGGVEISANEALRGV